MQRKRALTVGPAPADQAGYAQKAGNWKRFVQCGTMPAAAHFRFDSDQGNGKNNR